MNDPRPFLLRAQRVFSHPGDPRPLPVPRGPNPRDIRGLSVLVHVLQPGQ